MSFEKYLFLLSVANKRMHIHIQSPQQDAGFSIAAFHEGCHSARRPDPASSEGPPGLSRGGRCCCIVQKGGPASPCWKWTFFWYLFISSTFLWLFGSMRHDIWLGEGWPPKHNKHAPSCFLLWAALCFAYDCWHWLYLISFKPRKEVA